MTPERYKQINHICRTALELEPAEWAAYLAEACGGDEILREEVESLLAYDGRSAGMIDQPAFEVAAQAMAESHYYDQETSAANSRIGQSVGHYRILSLLGKGGMGEVYLGEDTKLGRKVAIKLLPAVFTTDPERVRRFTQESRAASATNHPNIITIHEIGEAPTEQGATQYIVTEYVDGVTLRMRMANVSQKEGQHAEKRGIEAPEAIDIAIQIASALSAAHETGIIHRDIKPENVMMRRDGIVKILDFGLAKLTETLAPYIDSIATTLASNFTETGVVIGTLRYMSPEQARGEKVDARTDIFSLGVMLYEMVAGRAPFAGATTNETIAAILRDPPQPITEFAPDSPPELERILSRALRKARDERYQTAKELLADLKDLAEKLSFEARLERDAAPESAISTASRMATAQTSPTAIATHQSENEEVGSQTGPMVEIHTGETDKVLTTPRGMIGKIKRHKLVVALTLAALMLASITGYTYYNRQPALTSKDTILLADFENKTGDDLFDKTLKQGLATQLEQSGFISVSPEARVRQTLLQMERAPDTRVTPELAQEICERQNLKAFIAGSISPLGNHFVITLAALHGRSGEELTRAQAIATSKEQVLHALEQATAQLRAQLGKSLSSIRQSDQPLEQATTRSIEALRAYSAGYNLNVSGRIIESIPLMRRATELDPRFAAAYDHLVISCSGTEQPEAAAEYQAKEVQLWEEKAIQFKYPESEDNKLDIDTWYQRLVPGNLSKSLEILLMRRQMWPTSPRVHNDLGLTYALTGQSEQALTPLKETIRFRRDFAAPYRWLALSLIRLNRFAEAKDTVTQALQLKLGLTEFHTQLYQLAFIPNTGQSAGTDVEGMRQQLDWAKGKPDEYVALNWQTGTASYAGQWRQAQEFSRRAIELAVRCENREVAARYATEQALRSAVLGDCRLSKSNAVQGLSLARGRIPLSRASLAFALCGETGQAKSIVDELAKRYPEDTLINSIWLPMIRAAMALERGASGNGVEQAIKELEITSRYDAVAEFWPQYLRGQAYLKLKQGAEAAAEFQKILDHRGYAPLSLLYPLAHLGLARAAEIAGDPEKSGKAHADFSAIWKDADAGLPIGNF